MATQTAFQSHKEKPPLTPGMMDAGVTAMTCLPPWPEHEIQAIWDAIWQAYQEGK